MAALPYAGFLAFVAAMLFIDLRVAGREAAEPRLRRSAGWVGVWIGLAVAFGVGILLIRGPDRGAEYFAGYLTEYALSVDNMFVFLVIFNYFRVPSAYQHRVLFFGIIGAVVFRGLFIAAGVALVGRFEFLLLLFGVFLVFTAFRIAKDTAEYNPGDNPIMKHFSRRIRVVNHYDGQRFITREAGKRAATPLLVVLLIIETTDIVFALDSIPAIFGITRDPFIILTSNLFAVLGLRALYFLLAGGMDKFHLLKYGLAVILGFVGAKMLLTAVPCRPSFAIPGVLSCHQGGVEITTVFSLGVIAASLALTAVASIRYPKQEEASK